MLNMLVVEEAADNGLDFIFLAVTGVCARIGDDSAAASDDGRVFDKAAVGIFLKSGQDRYVNAALLERMLVVVVLFDGALIDRLAEFGRAGDAVAQRLARASDDYVGKLSHREFLSLDPWLQNEALPDSPL